MAEGLKETLLAKLLDSVPLLLILLGACFAVLGLAGGVIYQQWLPMPDPLPRSLSAAFGVLLIAVGIVRSHPTKISAINPLDYGIKIQYPAPASRVNTVDVGGSIEKDLPNGYCLRVFRIYPGSNNFVPLAKARVELHKKTWVAERCHIGGDKDDQRFFAVYLCGPSAEVLVAFHNEAVSVHRKTMDQLRDAGVSKVGFLPSVTGRTEDMHECDRVAVIHS
jgi:hypothetical protein